MPFEQGEIISAVIGVFEISPIWVYLICDFWRRAQKRYVQNQIRRLLLVSLKYFAKSWIGGQKFLIAKIFAASPLQIVQKNRWDNFYSSNKNLKHTGFACVWKGQDEVEFWENKFRKISCFRILQFYKIDSLGFWDLVGWGFHGLKDA